MPIFLLAGLISFTADNDDVILTIIPVLLSLPSIQKNTSLLFSAFIAANVFSMFSLISNPTNIIASTAFSISFPDFLKIMFFPAVTLTVTAGIITKALAKKPMLKTVPSDTKITKNQLFSLIIGFSLITTLATQGLHHATTAISILFFSSFVLLRDIFTKQVLVIIKNLPIKPGLIITFGFVCLGIADYFGLQSVVVAQLVQLDSRLTPILFFVSTIFLSMLIVNIPAALLLANIALALSQLDSSQSIAIFAAIIIASNISALFSVRSTLAGQLFVSMAEPAVPNIRQDFRKFMLLPKIALSLVAICIIALMSV
ncbi:hypothetical protein KBC31_00025 [Candidatus Saccharibacteria bacterium]|nr:hypothetical protein [Candidatus Saccharibacteria bacterium]